MEKPVLQDVVELTKYIINEYFKGNPKPWFEALSSNSVFIATGEDMLFGAENIKNRLRQYGERGRGKMYHEEYFHIPVNANVAVVFAKTISGTQKDDSYRITSLYTFVYQLIGKETKMIFEHTSYEYSAIAGSNIPGETLEMDTHTFQFVKRLLMDNARSERIAVPVGSQTVYLDMNSLIYVQGEGHRTKLHCLDRVISCPKAMHELKELLSEDFYQIHRSYLINLKYLISIRCYEAQMLNNIKIPIPSATYGKIKEELEERLQRPLREKKENKKVND